MTTRSPHSFPPLRHFWWPTCCHSQALSFRLPHLRWPMCHLDRGLHVDGAPSFPNGFLWYAEENSVYVLGGEVAIGEKQEYGKMEISMEEDRKLYRPEAVCGTRMVWMTMVTKW